MHNTQDPQLKATRRVLAELADIAEHASLTGSLRTGVGPAAQAYNGALAALKSRGLVPEGMFEPVDVERADFGQIGVQCRLLMATIAEEEEHSENRFGEVIALAPFLASEDLAQLVRERLGETSRLPDGLLTGLAPFLDSELLGDLVRRQRKAPEPPAAPSPAPHPVAVPDVRPAIRETEPDRLEALAAELRRPDLTVEDRQSIAIRLAELAHEQSSRALE